MFTTGCTLTRERVKNLKEAGLEILVIRLDHYTAEIHDKGRRTTGIFDYALNAINLFQDEGFYVAVSFVPDKPLVSDRQEIVKVIEFFKIVLPDTPILPKFPFSAICGKKYVINFISAYSSHRVSYLTIRNYIILFFYKSV